MDIPIELIISSFEGTLSGNEEKKLKQWFSESDENRKQYQELKQVYFTSGKLRNSFEPDAPKALLMVNRQIKAKRSIRLLVQSAAAILLLLFATQFVLRLQSTNGWTEITVQQRQIVWLPDSSKVILAPNAQLSYPKKFNDDERKVRLNGTAYFEVTHNPQQPFQIKTPDTEVEVLGTKFMVENDQTGTEKVLVDEGKVAFSSGSFFSKQKVILTKNEIGTWNAKEHRLSEAVNSQQNSNAWLSGQLLFNQLPLNEVFQTLENQFNIQIDLQDKNFESLKYSGQFTAKEGAPKILRTICLTLNLSLENNENKYIIKP